MGFPIGARFAHPDRGYQGDQDLAAEHLQPGEVYTVLRLEVGRTSSTLYLDVPGLRDTGFNTTLFDAAELSFEDEDDEAEPASLTAGDATCNTIVEITWEEEGPRPCGQPSRFVVSRSDGDESFGTDGTEEACEGHLLDAVLGMVDGDEHVRTVVAIRWDASEKPEYVDDLPF